MYKYREIQSPTTEGGHIPSVMAVLSVTVSCTEMTKCVHSLHNKNKQKAIGLFHRLLFMKYGLSLLSTQREKALDIKYDDE